MVMAIPYSPIVEDEEEDYYEEARGCNCNCFHIFSLNWGKINNNNEDNHPLKQKGETWVVKNLKKVKEGSEVIAGPKWKTFIRKISGYLNKQNNNQFHYDPQSYALNFDREEDDDLLLPAFSSRFAVPSHQRQ